MTFKGPGGFGRIVNIIMNVFMCAVFSFFMLWNAQQQAGGAVQILTPLSFVISFITAFGIGYVTADLIPVFHAGSAVANKLNLKGVPAYLVTVLVIDLIITTILCLFMTFINTVERAGFVGFLMTWLQTYPIALLIGYIVQLIVMKPAMLFAKSVTGFDPDNPMPPAGGPPMGGMPASGPPVGSPPTGAIPGAAPSQGAPAAGSRPQPPAQ